MKLTKKVGNWALNKYVIAPILMWLYSQKWYYDLIMKWMPRLRLSTTFPVPENTNFIHWGALAQKGFKKLQPGDIILTHDKDKILTKIIGKATANENEDFIPAHAALCVSNNPDDPFQIAEMTQHNFTKSTWTDLCYESTRVMIIRCKDFSKDYIQKALIPKCKSFRNVKYDIKFNQGAEELICSELVYFSDVNHKLDVDLTPLIGHKPYISPMGLLKAKNIEIIWDSNKEY